MSLSTAQLRPTRVTRSSTGLISLIAAGLLWGTGGITGRSLANSAHLSPISIAAYRLGLGGGLVVLSLLLSGQRPPRSAVAWRRILAVAALAAVFQAAYFSAVAVGTVSVATLVAIGSSPVFVLLYESVRSRRRPERRAAAVVLLALVGLTMLVGVPAGSESMPRELAGAGLAAFSGLTFAAFTILGRRPLVGVDERGVTGYGFGLGGLLLVPIALLVGGLGFPVSADNFGLLALLAIAPTALAYTLFFRGLRTVAAATATVIALLEPLTGTLLSIALLGERLSLVGSAGAVLLGVAIVISARTPTAPTSGGV